MFPSLCQQHHDQGPDPYRRAFGHILRDCPATGNAHANISAACLESLNRACAGSPGFEDLKRLIETHASPLPSAQARKADRTVVDDGRLRRVVAWSDYIQFHRKAPRGDRSGGGDTITNRGTNRVGARSTTVNPAATGTLDKSVFKGTTASAITWWTFGGPADDPATGREWCAQLALPKAVIDKAEESGAVAVITIELGSLPADTHLYKPTALDGFGANSPFKPEWTGKPHGLTNHPSVPRPELISQVVVYRDLRDGAQITVTQVSFDSPRPSAATGSP